MSPILEDWKQRRCVLGTMHKKEEIIAPLLAEALGITVTVPVGFDTDRFGTFTGDIARAGTQLEAARAKASAAMAMSGCDLGLASEGSFGEHPSLPFLPSSLELVLLIDAKHNLEIIGHHRTNGFRVQGHTVTSGAEALTHAEQWGFPTQGIIVWTSTKRARCISKDIVTTEELVAVCDTWCNRWFYSSVFIETDMRAHRCPARRASIAAATQNLITACQSLCPHCTTPGFVLHTTLSGLPCGVCGHATERAQILVYQCQRCHHTERRAVAESHADPGECEYCNP